MSTNPNSALAVFNKPADLMKFLEGAKSAIAMALPKHLNPDRMLRLALTAFSTTPALRQCTGQSILASLVIAGQLGLEPGVAGQGYLIPYKTTCQFVPGWQGLVGLLNNTGRATAWTNAIYEGDVFEFELGSAPRLKHVPGENYGDPDKMTHVYACGKVNGSETPVVECWTVEKVKKHRQKYNKVGNAHYSFQHFEMYARKVVLLQVLKYMPKSVELSNAMTAAHAGEVGVKFDMKDGVIEMEEPETEVRTSDPAIPEREGLFDAPREPREKRAVPREKVPPIKALRNLAAGSRRSEKAVLEYLERNGMKYGELGAVPDELLEKLVAEWPDIFQDIDEDLKK